MNDARAIDLPPALRDWTPWLGWFDTELAELLGDMVLRMAELVGPTYSTCRAGGEEPDGLGDIRTRGSYERLIATEWALADEVPEEFLRRAASSEHLFLTPRLRTPVSERSIVAIFDTGPLQLGAARLAHVAAWVLLSRRAAELGGRLRWGQMQAPGVLSDDTGESALRALLKARTYQPAGPSSAADWLKHLNDAGREAPEEIEVWWIGFGLAVPPREASAWHALRVRPDMLGEHLEVSLDKRAGSRRAQLPLPPERSSAMVIRGEFKTPVAQPLRLDGSCRIGLTLAPILSHQSSHIGVRDVDGHSILVFALPREPQKGVITPRRHTWSTRRSTVATLLNGRQPGALCVSGESLHFWQLPGFGERERPSPDVFDSTVAAVRMLPMALLEGHFVRRLCVIDRTGRLVAWDALKPDAVRKAKSSQVPMPDTPGPEAQVVATGAIGMVQVTDSSAHVVIESPEGPCLLFAWFEGRGRLSRMPLCPPIARADKAYFAYVTPRRQAPLMRGVALRHSTSPERWTVLPRQGAVHRPSHVSNPNPVEVLLGPGLKSMGLCVDAKGDLQLVVLGVDRMRLMLQGLDGRISLLVQMSTPIEQCTVDPLRSHVVFITRGRDLVVMDPREERTLLHVQASAGGDA